MSEVMSKNVARLAILATFSRTGYNWAALDFSGNADLPGLIGTGHYQPDGTFTDWQSGGSRVRVPSPPPKVLVTGVCECGDSVGAGANVANCSHTVGTGVRKESCLGCSSKTST